MEINLTDQVKGLLQAFLLLILPLIVIVLGIIFTIENAWYFLLAITWFGSGVIFFSALN
ncbi:MAG: hypothetical protein KAQ84_02020 [Thermoplasmatales archaeon]|nr:hypothetical protein [Thermoplasmatales archaeon]MCK5261693.1 hypothetical protein [Thermoplasmatales archaeon]